MSKGHDRGWGDGSIGSLPHKYEDLSLDPGDLCKKAGRVCVAACNSRTHSGGRDRMPGQAG